MKYIKHDWSYYKEITLKDLDKKELIELIQNAIEIENKIIHKVERIYDRRWYNQPYVTYCDTWTLSTSSATLNWNALTLDTSTLASMSTWDLTKVAMSISG